MTRDGAADRAQGKVPTENGTDEAGIGDPAASFDQPGCERTVTEIELDRLTFGLSPRLSSIDRSHVAVLVNIVSEFPPILVHSETLRVIDGVHRVVAARKKGMKAIRAELFRGDVHAASIKAIECNIAHGKPLTMAERERAARRVLSLHPNWSDRRVALTCGVSPATVAVLRRRACLDTRRSEVRVGRDGKARPVDPGGLRRRIADELEADPEASIRKIAERTGASQGTVRDVRTRVLNGQDILSPQHRRQSEYANGDAGASAVVDDPAYEANDQASQFVDWFKARHIEDDGEWAPFVGAIPIGRVYEVADAARRCGESWLRLASALELRTRGRRHAS